jgi:phytoene dehydrogenase-like protein
MSEFDAIIVGAGPNGLAAAVTLARAGLSVRVYERNETIGGGSRTAELTLPGFHHDICSAVHPMALASGFFRRFQLEKRITLVNPDVSYGHPLDDGRAGIAYRDIDRTADALGVDGAAWKQLMGPLSRHADHIAQITGSQLLQLPRHPVSFARFGLRVLEQGNPATWNLRFRGDAAPAMLTGVAAHAIRPMPSLSTAGAGLALATYAHGRGWPIPIGGSQVIVDALADDLRAHGGEIVTGAEITSLDELPSARAVLLDLSPRALLALTTVPAAYARTLERFRFGNAVAKVDFALSGPVPWATRGPRWRPPRRMSRPVATATTRTCSSPSRPSSTRPGRPARARCSGPTPTFRATRRSTRRRPSRDRSSASRPASVTSCSAARA